MSIQTELAKLIHIIQMFRDVNQYITPQQIQIVLLVAKRPGITAEKIAEETDIALSSVSRNLTALGTIHRTGRPGSELLESVPDPEDRRRQITFLSVRGRTLVRKILQMLDPESEFDAPLATEWLNKTYKASSWAPRRGAQ